MPVFTATATALLSSTALAGSFIATNLLASGLAYGVGHLLGVFDVPDVGAAEDQGVELRLAASTQNRLPTLYGEWMERGRTVYAEVSENKQNYHTVIALGEGPVDSIDKVFWNEYELTFNKNGVVTDAVAADGTTTDQLNGNITVQTYLGTTTGNNSTYLEDLSETWTSTDKMTGIVYAVVSLKYNRDAGVTSLADMRFVGTSPVNNPADAIQNLLTNSRYGLGLSSSDINTASFAAAKAHYNDMVNYVDLEGDTVKQKRHEVNGSISTSNDVINRIQTIGRGCNTELIWSDGQWGLFVNKEDNATTFEFNTSNIIGSIQVVEPGLNSLFNRVEVSYGRNADNNYQRADAYVEAAASVLYPNELTRTQTLDLPLVATSQEAKRVATLNINQARQQLTVSHTADATAMPLEAGDIVRYTDADYGWSSKLFRITSITEVNEESSLTYQVTAIEYADAVYDFVVNEDDVAPNVPENDVAAITAVNDLAVSGQFPNRSIPAIQLSWTVPDNSLIEVFDIFFSVGGTQFDSTSTVYAKSTLPTASAYVSGDTVTEDVTGIPAGNITFWVVARNDYARSSESNGVTITNYQPSPIINAETIYRFNETPSVINGINIDVGAPPANATGIGTGRNNNANDTGWYESELDSETRENAPVWTGVTTLTRADASPRELDFEFSGTSGDTIITETPVNQIIDFTLAGTIGDRELQYAARPEVTQFTFSGQAAEADSVDPGLAEVWQIDVTGNTQAPAVAVNEEFYILPAGTSNEIVQTAGTFTFTPSGDTSDGVAPENIDASATGTIRYGNNLTPGWRVRSGGTFISSLDNNSSITDIVLDRSGDDYSDIISFFNVSTTFANLPSGTILNFTNTDGAVFRVTEDDMQIRSFNSGNLQIRRVNDAVFTTFNVTPSSGNTAITPSDTAFTLDFNSIGTVVQSSVSITLDSDTNSYTLADNLSGGATIGAALNTAIGTDFTGFIKTLDATTGAITFTADDFDDHTGSSSVTQGTNGTIVITDSSTPEVNTGTNTTIQIQVTQLSINQTITLESNITGQVLLDDIETKLLANTPITNRFTVSQDTATIDGNSETIIKLVAIPAQNLSLALTINSGITGTTSGTLVDGAASSVATSITITYDPDLTPVTQMLTFGENALSRQVAAELVTLIDGHGDLIATQGDTYTENEDTVSFQHPTADQIVSLTNSSNIANFHANNMRPISGMPITGVVSVLDITGFQIENVVANPPIVEADVIGKTILFVNRNNLSTLGWGAYSITSIETSSDSDYAYDLGVDFITGFGNVNRLSSFQPQLFFTASGSVDDVLPIFNLGIETITTTFIEDLTSSSILIKPDIVGNQTEPVITINTQGDGNAAFAVSTPLGGRSTVPGSPAFTQYTISYDGVQLSNDSIATAYSSSQSASQIAADINTLTELTATVSNSVVTVTSTANSAADTTISITPGTNEPGKTSTNDLAVSRAVTKFGSDVDVFAGTDTTATVRVSGEVYYTTTYNATDDTIAIILADLETNIDEAVDGFDLDERWNGVVQDGSTIRATALGTGTTPTITISIATGSTATVDSIGNITTTPATLNSTRVVIDDGVDQDVTSGELSTYTVVQGTDTLIAATNLLGASSASSVVSQITSAISLLSNSEYTTSASGDNLLSTLLVNGNTPDLTITVTAGLNSDDTAADLAVVKTVNQEGSTGTLDLTDADWTYYISSPTTDGDTTMITGNGTIAVRRGLFLNSLAASRDGANDSNSEVVFTNDLYTTAAEPSIVDITGVLHFYVGITAASDDIPVFGQATMQYTADTTDLPNATWTSITGAISNRAFVQVASGDSRVGAQQYVSVSFAADNFAGLTANTQYAFRVLLEGIKSGSAVTVPTNVNDLLYATFQLQEILTTT